MGRATAPHPDFLPCGNRFASGVSRAKGWLSACGTLLAYNGIVTLRQSQDSRWTVVRLSAVFNRVGPMIADGCLSLDGFTEKAVCYHREVLYVTQYLFAFTLITKSNACFACRTEDEGYITLFTLLLCSYVFSTPITT